VANSQNVRHRIKKHYGREADVIYPPVEIDSFTPGPERGDYYLVVSALVPYKRVDLAVEAFCRLGQKLIIVGSGPEEKRLKKMAQGKIEFVPWQGFDQLKEFYQNCQALIFPGEEDFGIVPVEAQACGKPVIAFGRGGVLETVQGIYPDSQQSNNSPKTGVFFREQTAASLIDAVKYFETLEFDPNPIRQSVLRFKSENYKDKMKEFVTRKLEIHRQTFSS
ncbi:MAG: glycosyltransferase, partial [candidate division Zixibacteria bacterium]|nr:glycosyltransferase [candidate division Zixibacteria bacterium]